MQYNLININPKICGGQPTLKGRRLTVYDVVSGIYDEGLDIYLADRDVTLEEARQAVYYAKDLQCQKDNPDNYCHGCILRTIREGWKFSIEELTEIALENGDKIIKTEDGNLFIGDKEEYIENRFGKMGWAIAENVYEKYKDVLSVI